MRWLIEPRVFSPRYGEQMIAALQDAGHAWSAWEDDWWTSGLPDFDAPVIFHGSLGNAAEIAARCPQWRPGAFCDVEAFRCAAWYPRAERWLLQRPHLILPASALVADPQAAASALGADALFVRPDSPLKPFSGRVLPIDGITLQALDHGFYYDDEHLLVVAAPPQAVGHEWRFVVVDQALVAGSAYLAEGRAASAEAIPQAVQDFAAHVAAELEPPERVYVLDVCESEAGLRLMELNPFSGADLYGCDLRSVIAAVSAVAAQMGS